MINHFFCNYLIINIHSTSCQSLVTVAATVFLSCPLERAPASSSSRACVSDFCFYIVNTNIFLSLDLNNSVSFYCRAFEQKSFKSTSQANQTVEAIFENVLVRSQGSEEYILL